MSSQFSDKLDKKDNFFKDHKFLKLNNNNKKQKALLVLQQLQKLNS